MGTPSNGPRADLTALVRVAPFVGRSQELGWLERWLREARAGYPGIVLIEGDAGIGKTRLLHEARSIAARLGVQVYACRCREDLALPYLPFIEALRPHLGQLPDKVRRTLGPHFEIVSRLLHGAASVEAPAHPPAPPDQDKLQLLLAMGDTAVKLAQARPVLFVVDDLHWADEPSLDLFEHLAFTLSDAAIREPMPFLIIGTHRPLHAQDRLARLTMRLQREAICRTFSLDGLSEDEIGELLGGLGLRRPSHQLTVTVTGATRGNPLFVQEVVHHLVRHDAIREQGGYLVAETPLTDLALPRKLTAAIVSRTHGLSPACRRLLTLASFLGESFSFEVMRAVSAMEDDALFNLLEEATRHQILRSEGSAFSFEHPLVRHVFYLEPSAPRRQRLHQQIAQSLRQLYEDASDDGLLEVAHHLVRAGAAADTATVLDYARRAGDRAFSLFAWNDAARYYEAALAAGQGSSLLSIHAQAELHYRAGLAHYYDQDIGPCRHHYERAIQAYSLTTDVPGLARALLEQTRASLATTPLGTVSDLKPLEDVLAALGDREPGICGHITAVMAEAYRNGRQPEHAKHRGQQALETGRQLGDDHLCAYASFALGLGHINDLGVLEALHCWEQALVYARRADDVIREGRALHRIPLALTLLGRLDEADSVATQACETTRKSRDWGNYSVGLSHLASVAAARGDFDLVERHVRDTIVMVSRSRFVWGGFRSLLALACARALRETWPEAHDALDVLLEPGRVFDDAGPIVHAFVRVFRQLLHAYAGEGHGDVETLVADVIRIIGTDTYALAPLCALVELCEFAGAPTLAAQPAKHLARAAERGVVFSSGWMFLVPRVLGVAATLDRRWDAARDHFRVAVDAATAAGIRPELARTYLDHARLLIAEGGEGARRDAAPLVARAASLFAELGMASFARRADDLARDLQVDVPPVAAETFGYPDGLTEREVDVLVRLARGQTRPEIGNDLLLGGDTIARHTATLFEKIKVSDEAGATAYAVAKGFATDPRVRGTAVPPLRIILVSDVVASTTLIQRVGDAKAHDLMQRHNVLLRECLAAHRGIEITHTGDGIEASFLAASNAIECAVAIQRAFASHNSEHPAESIQVRIGLNAGEPIPTEGRLFGAAVHAAFAICGRAAAGQILISDVVLQLIAGKGFRVGHYGRVALKGLGRMRLYEIQWEATT